MSGKRRSTHRSFASRAPAWCRTPAGRWRRWPRSFGAEAQQLGRWVHLKRNSAGGGNIGAVLDADDRAKSQRLRGENTELRLNHV